MLTIRIDLGFMITILVDIEYLENGVILGHS